MQGEKTLALGECWQMLKIGDVGRICINGEIRGICRDCLWLEWDTVHKRCMNENTSVCQLYWGARQRSLENDGVSKAS